ncbi:MAG: hypothetical protein Q8K36_04195 [Alphaproteobacteria bacterium]|nr:hypothetical protein [Alphaproteobacteria bacterium]
MRNYIDPEYLRNTINYRYPTTLSNSLLCRGYAKIFSIHEETLATLNERAEEIKRTLNAALGCADSTDINTLLLPLDELKNKRRRVGNNQRANSYTCAEQVALDYMSTDETQSFLKEITGIKREDVVGIIIHVHTTETPCGGSCATSLTRETESGGIFNKIFDCKPVKIICTSSHHYNRGDGQIPYDDTFFNEFLSVSPPNPIEFSISSAEIHPYPIVLYGKADRSDEYVILEERYSRV